jgi:potassium-dependent mechanosensitive channel
MLMEHGIVHINDLFILSRHFLRRPDVLWQLASIALYILLWIVLRGFAVGIGNRWRYRLIKALPKRHRAWTRRFINAIVHLVLPATALLGLYALFGVFQTQGRFTGLIREFILLGWAFLAFRMMLAILYALLPDRVIKRYHHRFLLPLFSLLVIARLVSTMISLEDIYKLPFLPFGLPLSIGAFLTATIGLYLWVVGTFALEAIVHGLTRNFSAVDKGTLSAGLTLTRYALIMLGIIVALRSLGLNATTVGFITGGLSVGVGIGLQSIISNFVSGIILLFERSLRPGDVIDIGGTLGTVTKLSIRSTEVSTATGKDIIIPNNTLLTSNVTTYSKNDRLVRLDIDISVNLQDDLKNTIQELLSLTSKHNKVLRNPAPQVNVVAFKDSSLDLSLKVWVADLNFGVKHELMRMIWEHFGKSIIKIN